MGAANFLQTKHCASLLTWFGLGPAKEHLIREVLDLDEDQAAGARLVVKRRRKAAERLRGMFVHVAPGVSLVDELIADRRAEVREEEAAETERKRIDSGSAKTGRK
jgi:hypothetical protein